MLYYDRIDISKGVDLDKSDKKKECMICHYWIFNHGLKFKNSICNGCHDLTMLSVNISNIAIIIVRIVNYCYIVHNISKSEAILFTKIMGIYKKNIALNFKSVFLLFLFSIYKMVDNMDTYTSSNITIETLMKNPRMLKFIPDHLKTKLTCNYPFKK